MLRVKDIYVAKKRRKKVGWLFWKDLPLGYFRKNHSLTCGCRSCAWSKYLKRNEIRSERRNTKMKNSKLKGTDHYTELEKELPIF